MTDTEAARATPATFWVGLAVGAVPLGYGVWWLLHNARLTSPLAWTVTIVVAALLHDLLFVPLALVLGRAVSRVLPWAARAPVIAGGVLTAVTTLASVPALGRFGARPSNPTLLPRDVGTGLLVVLALTWAAVGVAILVRARRQRRLGEPR